jgi:hypothetical protein
MRGCFKTRFRWRRQLWHPRPSRPTGRSLPCPAHTLPLSFAQKFPTQVTSINGRASLSQRPICSASNNSTKPVVRRYLTHYLSHGFNDLQTHHLCPFGRMASAQILLGLKPFCRRDTVNRTYVRRLLKASITHKHDTAGHASASLLRCYGHAGPSLNSRAALELIWIVQCIGFPGFDDSVYHHIA